MANSYPNPRGNALPDIQRPMPRPAPGGPRRRPGRPPGRPNRPTYRPGPPRPLPAPGLPVPRLPFPPGIRLPIGPIIAAEIGFAIGMWIFRPGGETIDDYPPWEDGGGFTRTYEEVGQCVSVPGSIKTDTTGSIYCGPLRADQLGGEGFTKNVGMYRTRYELNTYEDGYAPASSPYRYFLRQRWEVRGTGHANAPPPAVFGHARPVPLPMPSPAPWAPEIISDFPLTAPIGNPMPFPVPTPVPWSPSPRPRPRPNDRPQNNTNDHPADQPNPQVGPKPQPLPEPVRPPPPRSKERKVRVRGASSWVHWALSQTTEAIDLVDVAHDALDPKCRAKPVWVAGPGRNFGRADATRRDRSGYNWRRHVNADGRFQGWRKEIGYYRQPTPQEKAMAVYRNPDCLDIGKFLAGYTKEQIEDKFYGLLGENVSEAARRSGRPFGYEAGPAL